VRTAILAGGPDTAPVRRSKHDSCSGHSTVQSSGKSDGEGFPDWDVGKAADEDGLAGQRRIRGHTDFSLIPD
jgi:hypothetical protein